MERALLRFEPPKSLEEWSMAMKSMQKIMKNAPGITNPRCFRYKWVTHSFWDFRLRQQVHHGDRTVHRMAIF